MYYNGTTYTVAEPTILYNWKWLHSNLNWKFKFMYKCHLYLDKWLQEDTRFRAGMKTTEKTDFTVFTAVQLGLKTEFPAYGFWLCFLVTYSFSLVIRL